MRRKLIGESLKFTPGEGAPAASSAQMRTDLVGLWKLRALIFAKLGGGLPCPEYFKAKDKSAI
jgi:hypothetical protein